MTRSRPWLHSLEARLGAASAVLAVVVVGVFFGLILALSALREANKQEAHSKDVTSSALALQKVVLDMETGLRGYVLTGQRRFLEPYEDARLRLPKSLRNFQRLVVHDPKQQAQARDISTDIHGYVSDYVEPVLRFAREESLAAGRAATEVEGKRRIDDLRREFDRFLAAENVLAAARERSASQRSERAIVLGVSGLAVSALFILLFGLYLARSIARPVRDAAAGATTLAGGDLSLRLEEGGPGEVGELTRAFNRMVERLKAARSELEAQNEQLRESERLKSELVNTVSHELRTPLASVLGFTKLLLTRDFESETRRHYHGIVDAQARRLSELIDDFLDVRRIEEGRFEQARELVDIAPLLRDEAQLYSGQSDRHRVELDLPQEPLRVRGDADRLRQVIGNLLSNAIKYSPGGGIVELGAQSNGGAVRVHVRDEGIGIAADMQPHIFTKFFRGDATASGITGTGLGLALSRDIVELHGGRIGFVSAEGEGSTFWVELPSANGGDRKPQGE